MEPPSNRLVCDPCGFTEALPLVVSLQHVSEQEACQMLAVLLVAIKQEFAIRGWATSVGYDLCPRCVVARWVQGGWYPDAVL